MIVNFDAFKDFEVPMLRLCNANDSQICVINNPINFTAEYNFNDFSTISFRVDKGTDPECYKRARVRMEILLGVAPDDEDSFSEDCGYFVITEVKEEQNDREQYKEIVAKSCEYELSNVAMPYIGKDDGFNTYGSRVLYHEFDDNLSSANDYQAFKDRSDAPSIMRVVKDHLPGWSVRVEDVDEKFNAAAKPNYPDSPDALDALSVAIALKREMSTRAFETDDSDTIYGFLMGDVAEAFGCVFMFDIYHRRIHIMAQESAISPTDIYLSNDTLLSDLVLKETEDDRVNSVLVTGSDSVSIASVNPTGNNVIYHFTNEYDGAVMSATLWSIVREWQDAITDNNRKAYKQVVKDRDFQIAKRSMLETVKLSIDTKLNIAKQERLQESTAIIYPNTQVRAGVSMAEEHELHMAYYDGIIEEYEEESSDLQDKIDGLTANIDTNNSTIQLKYIDTYDFYAYISNRQNLTDAQKDSFKSEFTRLLRTYSYQNTNIVLSESLKQIDSVSPIPQVEKYDVSKYDGYKDGIKWIASVITGEEGYHSAFETWVSSAISTWSTSASAKIGEQMDVAEALYQDAYSVLQRTSMPRREITIESSNFIFVQDFDRLSEQLKTGCGVWIELPARSTDDSLDERFIAHYVLRINVDYTAHEFSMTLSNRYRLNDALSIFEDSYGNTASIASITSSQAVTLGEQQKRIDDLELSRQQSLNYTKQALLMAEHQEFDVDDTGMTVRTILHENQDGTKEYDPCQYKLVGGSILFTDDGWETAGLAVGKYYDPRKNGGRGGWTMGVNGEHIMANTIEASSLTVGSMANTSGTNLLMDGSFDVEIHESQNASGSAGSNAWMVKRSVNGVSDDNYDPRDNQYITLVYDANTDPYSTYRVLTQYVRLNSGCSMTITKQIPVYKTDGILHLCLFLNGSITVSAKVTLNYGDGHADTINAINYTTLDDTLIRENKDYHKVVEILSIPVGSRLTRDSSTMYISLTISYCENQNLQIDPNSAGGYRRYADISCIFISDSINCFANPELTRDIIMEGRNISMSGSMVHYPLNYCSRFESLPIRHWGMWDLKDGTAALAAFITNHANSSAESNGLLLPESSNYFLFNKTAFDISDYNGKTIIHNIKMSGGIGCSALVNTYIITHALYNQIQNNRSSSGISIINSALEGNGGITSPDVISKVSTYINIEDEIELSSVEFAVNYEGTDTSVLENVHLVCMVSTNLVDGEQIWLNSVSLLDSTRYISADLVDAGVFLNIPERRTNPWCNVSDDMFVWFSHKFLSQLKYGGFDDGSYLIIPPGVSLVQRKKFVVFAGLPYYLSCYVKGRFRMAVLFYAAEGDTATLNDPSDPKYSFEYAPKNPDFAEWTRFECGGIIDPPQGAKYANVVLEAIEDEDFVGCHIDGAMFEQSTCLNAYKNNNYESYAKYTTIDSNGICIRNGAIKIYNNANNLVMHSDSYGNLELSGKITAESGKIGGWNIGSNKLYASVNNITTAEIDSNGSFISNGNNIKTEINGGNISFKYGNSTIGNIRSSTQRETFFISSSTPILFNSKSSDVMELSDMITFYKKIGDCTFSGSVKTEADLVSESIYANSIYVNGKNVVTTEDVNIAIDTLSGKIDEIIRYLPSFYSSIIQEVENMINSIPPAQGLPGTPPSSIGDVEVLSSNGSDESGGSASKKMVTNWEGLYKRMSQFSNVSANLPSPYVSENDYRDGCNHIAKARRDLFSTAFSDDGGWWNNAYISWANSCGYTITYA